MAKRQNGASAALLEQVTALAQPLVEEMGLSLWDVELKKEGGALVLRYTLDAVEGVDLDTCEAFSRAVEKRLDEVDPIDESYRLEVQSAGIDRALKRPSDFAKFLGSAVEIKLYAPLGGCLPEAEELSFAVCDALLPAAVKSFEARLLGFEKGVLRLEDSAGKVFSLRQTDTALVRLAIC